MRLLVNRDNAQRFDTLVKELLDQQNTDQLKDVLQAGSVLITGMMYYYSDLAFDATFANDLVIECLQRLLVEAENTTPTRVLRNLTHTRVKHLLDISEITIPTIPDIQSYKVDLQSRLVFEETLHEVLMFLPLHIQSAILYLIFYPNSDTKFRVLYTPLDYYLILQGIQHLREHLDISKEEHNYFCFDLPTSQTARLLLVSSLYKLSPAILVLLMQTKKLEIVLQFCKLFGGQTIKIPRISEISSVLTHASEIAQKVEDGIQVGDQESLAYLATDIASMQGGKYDQLVLNPLLSAFIEQSLSVTLTNYEAAQKRLVSAMNTSDPEDIFRVRTLLDKEIMSQAYLLLQLTTPIDSYPAIQKILNILNVKNP